VNAVHKLFARRVVPRLGYWQLWLKYSNTGEAPCRASVQPSSRPLQHLADLLSPAAVAPRRPPSSCLLRPCHRLHRNRRTRGFVGLIHGPGHLRPPTRRRARWSSGDGRDLRENPEGRHYLVTMPLQLLWNSSSLRSRRLYCNLSWPVVPPRVPALRQRCPCSPPRPLWPRTTLQAISAHGRRRDRGLRPGRGLSRHV
jgi:hypothetical protein